MSDFDLVSGLIDGAISLGIPALILFTGWRTVRAFREGRRERREG